MKTIPTLLLAFSALSAEAKITITQTTCNYQKGLAVVTSGVRLGWQMQSDTDNDRQQAY